MATQTAEPKNSGKFGKGNPGKPKGATNKVTRELKEMILAALDQAGGVDYLVSKAESHPQAFIALIGKTLPMTVQGPNPDGSHTFSVQAPWLTQRVQQRNS